MRKQITAIVLLCSFGWNTSVFGQVSSTVSIESLGAFSAEEILQSENQLRKDLQNGLKDDRVIEEMHKLGVSQIEMRDRLMAMTDSELLEIQKGAHRQAGGEVVVISAGVVILILLLILLLRPARGSGGAVVVTQ